MRKLVSAFFVSASLVVATGALAGEPPASWLDAAHRAGRAVVLEEAGNGAAQVEPPSRISGKAIVLATAIASVAVVTAAWLLRGNRCKPGAVRVDLGDWWRNDLLDWSVEFGTVLRRGAEADGVPPPLPPFPPPPPLPDLEVCVPG